MSQFKSEETVAGFQDELSEDGYPSAVSDDAGEWQEAEAAGQQPQPTLLSPQQDLPNRLPRLLGRWVLSVVFLAGILSWLMGGFLESGLRTDGSSLSLLIGLLFLGAMALSLRQVLLCERERRELHLTWQARAQGIAPERSMIGPTADYLRVLHDSAVRGQPAPVDRMLQVLSERLHHPGTMVGLFSNLLITLGLIGTILGLLLSVQGLNQATETIARDPKSVTDAMGLLDAMRNAIAGMGIAFYTTLFGAVLGGVVLRILHTQVSSWVDLYTAFVAESTDALFQPTLQEQYGIGGTVDRLREAFGALQYSVEDLRVQLDALGGQTGFMEQLHIISQNLGDRMEAVAAQQQAAMVEASEQQRLALEHATMRQVEAQEQLGRDLRLLEPMGHAMRRIMGH